MDELKEQAIIIPDNTTGDPFVDAGNLSLQALTKRFPEKNIFGLIEFVTNIYVGSWYGKINTIFLNSKITNITFKGETKKTETLKQFKYYLTYHDDNSPMKYCRICGKKSNLFSAGRDKLCLSGSGKFVNFHHSHEEGLQLCAFCLTKLFFLPMVVIYLGGKLAIIDCSSDKLKKFWIKETLNKNLDKIGRNVSNGILKYGYSNPINAIFNMASDFITENQGEAKEEGLSLYHFTNFGASPDCNIYLIPNPVFKYMNYIINHCGKDWYIFINRYYMIKKSKWDSENQCWLTAGKQSEKMKKNEYLNNRNIVFERLISNKTILLMLRSFYKELSGNHKQNFNILLADKYVMEVLKMKKEQISLIKKIADVVYEVTSDGGTLKKYLTMFEGASKAYQLRHALLKIIKLNYMRGNKQPVCRLDDYVDYLFPDGQYWGEVRDMLIIYLYEKMHDQGVQIEIDDKELEITEIEDISITSI